MTTALLPDLFDWNRITRRADPETSRDAARRLVEGGDLRDQQAAALSALALWGPGTTHEIARRVNPVDAIATHYLLARRFPELARMQPARARVQKDAEGKDVKRNGSRVWEYIPVAKCTEAPALAGAA
jgi:hypothetical protein